MTITLFKKFIRFCSNPKNQQDVRFELDLQKELDNIPCDDDSYYDGKHAGFELGARWAYLQFRPKFVK